MNALRSTNTRSANKSRLTAVSDVLSAVNGQIEFFRAKFFTMD
jgi:hypothetical protein